MRSLQHAARGERIRRPLGDPRLRRQTQKRELPVRRMLERVPAKERPGRAHENPQARPSVQVQSVRLCVPNENSVKKSQKTSRWHSY